MKNFNFRLEARIYFIPSYGPTLAQHWHRYLPKNDSKKQLPIRNSFHYL